MRFTDEWGEGGDGIWEDIFHPGMLNAGLVQSAVFLSRDISRMGEMAGVNFALGFFFFSRRSMDIEHLILRYDGLFAIGIFC